MVKAGEITADEAEVHPHRNVLTRALGTEADVEVDEAEVPLMDGDRLLLCSDGLFGMVTEDQIQAILETEPDPQHAADRLIQVADLRQDVEGLPADEVAERLNCSKATVRSHIANARTKMRRYMAGRKR